VVSPTRDFAAPPLTATLGLVPVTGGQAAAHAPVHADIVPLSTSNGYCVKPSLLANAPRIRGRTNSAALRHLRWQMTQRRGSR
jgi:hypothetical protein